MNQFLNYVKMCTIDTDIQPLWKPSIGHKFIQKTDESEIPIIFTVVNLITIKDAKKNLIWLPYQEDIQNMLAVENFNMLLEEILNFLYKGPGETSLQMTGNEVLFAFAKFKLFHKKWCQGNWISF